MHVFIFFLIFLINCFQINAALVPLVPDDVTPEVQMVEMDAEASIQIMNEKVDAGETMKIENSKIDHVAMVAEMNADYSHSELHSVEQSMNKKIERDLSAEKAMNSVNGKFKPSQPKVANANKAKPKMFHFKPSAPKTSKTLIEDDDKVFVEAESKMSAAARSELASMNRAVVADKESVAMNQLTNDHASHLDNTPPKSHEDMNQVIKLDSHEKEMNAQAYAPVNPEQMQ